MRKSRLSKVKQDRLMEHFVGGTTARCAADLVGVNFKISAYYYQRLCKLIAYQTEREASKVFDGRRKGNRGREASGKSPVFGLLKRGGHVYTKIIPDTSSAILLPIIKRKAAPDSIVYSDCWHGYNALDV